MEQGVEIAEEICELEPVPFGDLSQSLFRRRLALRTTTESVRGEDPARGRVELKGLAHGHLRIEGSRLGEWLHLGSDSRYNARR